MTMKGDLAVACARAAEEKAMAKQRLSELKASLKPGAVLGRVGRRVGSSASDAAATAADGVRAHPAVAASAVAGVGLVLVAKPLGDLLADGLMSERSAD